MNARLLNRTASLFIAVMVLIAGSTQIRASQTGSCGGQSTTIPFNDVLPANVFFCSIAEGFFSGLTNGTTGTTYSPGDPVTREQMAAFVTRTMDQSLKRGSSRAALNQYWTTQTAKNLALTPVDPVAQFAQSDGVDIWVPCSSAGTVFRVRASDGKVLLEEPVDSAESVLCAMGKVFVTSYQSPGHLYEIDPRLDLSVTLVGSLGNSPVGIGYDGLRIWTANNSGSVSIITLNPTVITTVATGFTSLWGVIYDGSNIWVTDDTAGTTDKLRKLDSSGGILLSVDVGSGPVLPAFDGTNIWVPNKSSSTISVVRAIGGLAGTVLATLNGNGLDAPVQTAFDGERILVTNYNANSVSLWKASDLTPIGTFGTGFNTQPLGACSDGVNFWITLSGANKLARF